LERRLRKDTTSYFSHVILKRKTDLKEVLNYQKNITYTDRATVDAYSAEIKLGRTCLPAGRN